MALLKSVTATVIEGPDPPSPFVHTPLAAPPVGESDKHLTASALQARTGANTHVARRHFFLKVSLLVHFPAHLHDSTSVGEVVEREGPLESAEKQ